MDLSKEVLTDKYAFLVAHVKADEVLPKLVSARLVGREVNQEIENLTNAKKVQTLLDEIYRSPDPEWFIKFTTALSDTDENHKMIAEKLQAEYENRKQPKSVATRVSRSRTEPVVSTGSSAGKQPVPSSSAPPPAIGAGGTTPHHDQSSTRSQADEAALKKHCWIPFGIKTVSIEAKGGTLCLEPLGDNKQVTKEDTIFVEVPQDAVSTSADVKMHYAIIPSGSFTLPEGYQFGSPVVYIYYDGRHVTNSLALHLPNCYGGENHARDGLSFAVAPHSFKESNMYDFQLLSGGKFPVSSRYGVVEIGGHCSLFAVVFKVGTPVICQAVFLEKKEEHETVCDIAVTYATPGWLEILRKYRPDWKLIKSSSFKFKSDRITATLTQCHHDNSHAVFRGPSELLSCHVQCDSITSPELLEMTVKELSYPPSITCVVTYNDELRGTGRPTEVGLRIRGMDPEMEFQCKAYERIQVAPPPHTPGSSQGNDQQQILAQPPKVAPQGRKTLKQCDEGSLDTITDVSFAILLGNENEYLTVLNYFGMGFRIVSEGQLYTEDVLKCTFDSDPNAANLSRLGKYYSITINGKTGIIYRSVAIGSGGRYGAMMSTVTLLKKAKDLGWPLEIIFAVGCAGGRATPGQALNLGKVMVPKDVVEFNRGKVETDEDGQPKFKRDPELWQTSESWYESLTDSVIHNNDGENRAISIASGLYEYCSDFVIKDAGVAEELRQMIADPKMIGIEMEGVGMATAIKVMKKLDNEVPQFLVVKGISDNADGSAKGAPAPMTFFETPYENVYPDDRQVMAALMSVTLVTRAIQMRREWKENRPTWYQSCQIL